MPWATRICDLDHSSQQCQIVNPLNRARHQTHVLVDTSWACFLWATTRTFKICPHIVWHSSHKRWSLICVLLKISQACYSLIKHVEDMMLYGFWDYFIEKNTVSALFFPFCVSLFFSVSLSFFLKFKNYELPGKMVLLLQFHHSGKVMCENKTKTKKKKKVQEDTSHSRGLRYPNLYSLDR